MRVRLLRFYTGIFAVTTASLVFEIGLTRLFFISQGHHFSFMVISIALLGIGAGGSILMACKDRWTQKPGAALASLSAFLSSSTILSFALANLILFDPVQAVWNPYEFLKIMGQYLILCVPFILSGMIVSLAIMSMSEKVHRIYLADMAGAASGCLIVLYLFFRSGGEATVIAAAALALFASLLFQVPSRMREFMPPALAVCALAAALAVPHQLLDVRMSPYRELSQVLDFPGAKLLDTLHSPSGRLDIVESPAVRAAPGISLRHRTPLPPQIGFTVNGGGLGTVTDRGGDLTFLHHLPSSLVYRIKPRADVFVVDAGGGMEPLSALANGAKMVDGSETRGVVIDAMRGPLRGFSGNIYEDAWVLHGYGRTILGTSKQTFDVIQISRTDTLGAMSSGWAGLSEDYGVTVEAFMGYLAHLQDDGFVSASLYLIPPPRHELKLLATMAKALEATGREASKSIIAIRSWGVITILAKRGEITTSDMATVRRFCQEERFDLVWYPGMGEDEANIHNRSPEPVYHRMFRRILEGTDRDAFFRDYLFDVTATTDDRPFFGHVFKMSRMKETYESVGQKWSVLMEGGYLLPFVLVQSALASLLLIVVPLFSTGKRGNGRLLPVFVYFAAIGMGFMFVEITLIQRMIPVLGEPIYAISVVLFTILLSTGVGSWLAGRLFAADRPPVHLILMIPLLVLLYAMLPEQVLGWIAGQDTTIRFCLTFLILFPLGLVMGVPFPTGMALLGQRMPGAIPWAWCVNGTFSVISATASVMIAVATGFRTVQMLAALLYVAAWGALVVFRLQIPGAHKNA